VELGPAQTVRNEAKWVSAHSGLLMRKTEVRQGTELTE
ncbi:MAG: hypothetical protein QOI57_3157, partial [Rubrobacteraceae bacterium]|nr:hypothetical protein [Rubrobacteraceae bacterium]